MDESCRERSEAVVRLRGFIDNNEGLQRYRGAAEMGEMLHRQL